MKNLRVGFFLVDPRIWWGGAQIAALRVAQWLTAKSLPVEIIVSGVKEELPFQVPESVSLTNLNVPILVKTKPIVALSSVWRLAKYFRSNPPAIVVTLGWADGSLTLWARKIAHSPVRVAIWEQTHVSSMRINAENLYQRLAPTLIRLSYPMADVLVACSQAVAEDLARLTGLPRERIHTIYNPIAPDISEKSEEPVDHPWFTDGQPPVILGVGRLAPSKDFPTLIRAFSLVRQARPTRLVILGEGPERLKLETLIRQLRLEKEVDLPGYVDNPFKFMKRARVFVLSSLFEGLALVLVEALAVGTPVVATDCLAGTSEVLEGGKWGKLVPVGDYEALAKAILDTLENPPDREKLKERGMDFSVDKIGQRWLELLLKTSL